MDSIFLVVTGLLFLACTGLLFFVAGFLYGRQVGHFQIAGVALGSMTIGFPKDVDDKEGGAPLGKRR